MVRIIKPEVVGHFVTRTKASLASSTSAGTNPPLKNARNAIYSIDIQPSGGRFATAGGDASVKIWSLPALLSIKPGFAEESLLCSTFSHVTTLFFTRTYVKSPKCRHILSIILVCRRSP